MKKYVLCLSIIMNMRAMQSDHQLALTKALDVVDRFPVNAEQYLNDINKQGVPLKAAGDAGSVVLHAAVRKGCSLFILEVTV